MTSESRYPRNSANLFPGDIEVIEGASAVYVTNTDIGVGALEIVQTNTHPWSRDDSSGETLVVTFKEGDIVTRDELGIEVSAILTFEALARHIIVKNTGKTRLSLGWDSAVFS